MGTERMAAFVTEAMVGSRFETIDWVSETGSTNDDLMRRAAGQAPEQVLITDLQTAGRGRRGRVWTAPPASSILMSLLLHDQEPGQAFWSVGAVALAAVEAVAHELGIEATLKWPNDLLVDGAKVAGVLAQLQGHSAVVGIGLNANWPRGASVPTRGGLTPTSLNWHLPESESVDRPALVVAILRRTEFWLHSDPRQLRNSWQAACSTIGSEIRLDLGDDAVTGTAIGVLETGALIVDAAGVHRHFEAGDVVHLRPAQNL